MAGQKRVGGRRHPRRKTPARGRASTAERVQALTNCLQEVHRESLLAIVMQASVLSAIATVVRGLVRDRPGAVLPRLLSASVPVVAPFSPPGDAGTLDFVRSAEERRRPLRRTSSRPFPSRLPVSGRRRYPDNHREDGSVRSKVVPFRVGGTAVDRCRLDSPAVADRVEVAASLQRQ